MSEWFIRATDVLFFKDGREVAPGSEYSASSVFPPNPQTFYGALRSALLSNDSGTDFSKDDFGDIAPFTQKLVGTKSQAGDLCIEQYALCTRKNGRVESLYRLPADVLKRKKPPKGKEAVSTTAPVSLSKYGIRNNQPKALETNWFVHEEGAFFEYTPVFIPESLFRNYLLSNLKGEQTDRSDPLAQMLINIDASENGKPASYFVQEPRMGIVIDAETRTVEEGKLFTTPFIRLNDMEGVGFKLRLNINHNVLEQQDGTSLLRLGGDGKLASLEPLEPQAGDNNFYEELANKLKGQHHFKAVVTTPAIFKNGWIPDGIDPETLQGVINGVEVRLRSAVLSRFMTIGGWDVAINRPKPSRRAVAPGAVYYFESEQPLTEEIIGKLHAKSICSDEKQEYQKQGLGIIHLGVA